MKRFLIGAVAALILVVSTVYGVFYRGAYLNLAPGTAPEVQFRTEGQDILARCGDGWTELEIRSVDVLPNQPGGYAIDFAPREGDYLRWLEAIGEMGANTVQVPTIMDDDFYNALYDYNTSGAAPLYLLQGIRVTDSANYGTKDGYHEDFLGALLEDGLTAVDVIHGRRILSQAQISGGGRYWKDLSPWTIGYTVGGEWDADTVAYTDHSSIRSGSYTGKYFSTTGEATPFEAMLARVMDRMVEYESEKYASQRLIGFVSAPDVDFLEYEQIYARQLGKYAYLDAEHVVPTQALKSGCYAAYRLFGFCQNFSEYLSQGQRQELAAVLEELDTTRAYDGYPQLLSRYHTMPVVVSCGSSSARGTAEMDSVPRTEQQQGELLMSLWQDCVDVGLAGLSLSSWQDSWGHRDWNTAFALEGEHSVLWHDLQSVGQSQGILAFEPGERAVCVLDGDPSEWEGDEPVLERDGRSLYIRLDGEGLYLLIRGADVSAENPLYLPVDMVKGIGGTACTDPELAFARAAEFVLCLDGWENTRLLVHERYDAMRMNFSYAQGGDDPFVVIPPADSDRFSTVSMAVDDPSLLDVGYEIFSQEELRKLKAVKTWETGRLVHGIDAPADPAFNSLADFCFGSGCVEVRLPWLLLNVADPVDMEVHKDYYTCYGVETQRLTECWIGLGEAGETIPMASFRPERLEREPVWRERLKQSYNVIREHWN